MPEQGYFIRLNEGWFGPVNKPQEGHDGWLSFGVHGQGRIKPENWKLAPLKPLPRIAPPKKEFKPRLTLAPELLESGVRCFCARCGGYFKDERSFSAHQFKVGMCASDDKKLRACGLKIIKKHKIRGSEFIEWGLARSEGV